MKLKKLTYKIETLKNLVERILNKDNFARQNDAWLYFQVLLHQNSAEKLNNKLIIDLESISTITSPESASRIRRELQAQGKYLPDEDVISEREENCENSKLFWRGGKLTPQY